MLSGVNGMSPAAGAPTCGRPPAGRDRVGEITEKRHCKMVSHSDVYTPNGSHHLDRTISPSSTQDRASIRPGVVHTRGHACAWSGRELAVDRHGGARSREWGASGLGDLARCCLDPGYAFVIRRITIVPWRVTCTTAYRLIGYRSRRWTCLTKRICGGRIATAVR